ncbi:hypothetical protein [Streptomyces altiplanensis]
MPRRLFGTTHSYCHPDERMRSAAEDRGRSGSVRHAARLLGGEVQDFHARTRFPQGPQCRQVDP